MREQDSHWECPNHPGLWGVSSRAYAPLCHRRGCDFKVRMHMVHNLRCDGEHETGACNSVRTG